MIDMTSMYRYLFFVTREFIFKNIIYLSSADILPNVQPP